MALFDFITGTKRPSKDTPVLGVEELRASILALNRSGAPYQIRDGQNESADFVAEWKIVDAKWYEIFAKAGLEKVFKILLKLDPENHEVRAMDEEYTVEWQVGIPSLSKSQSQFKGQKWSMSSESAYAFTEDLGYGKVYDYKFATDEIKKPLQKVILDSGWTYKGIVPPASL